MTSGEMRKAEELASDWLTEKKVVRFNLDKNEVHTQDAKILEKVALVHEPLP